MAYSFGVPGKVIWSMHILLGLYFIYLAKTLQENKEPTNKQLHAAVLFTFGTLMISYHGYLMYLGLSRK